MQTLDNSSPTLNVAARLGEWLETYGEVATILPVLTGLFLTSRLQLRGAQGLLANLAIAALTRQMLAELKKQAHSPALPAATAPNPTTANGVATEDYTIVHNVPGRLRLKIPRLLTDSAYGKRLTSLLTAEARVLGVRLNAAAASLVIRYDPLGVSELDLGVALLDILQRAENPMEEVGA